MFLTRASILMLVMLSSLRAEEAATSSAVFPSRLPPEHRETYQARQEQLEANTSALQQAFAARDRQRVDELYVEREHILLERQRLMPHGEARIHEGMVTSKYGSEIAIRKSSSRSVSIRIGRIADPELRMRFDAIEVGDRVRLIFANQAWRYNNNLYGFRLAAIERIGPGLRNLHIFRQEQRGAQHTSVSVLHPDAASETVQILATIKNHSDRAIAFEQDQRFHLRVTTSNRAEVPHQIRHQTPEIGPGEVGIIFFEVNKGDFDGRYLYVEAGTRFGSLFSADLNIQR